MSYAQYERNKAKEHLENMFRLSAHFEEINQIDLTSISRSEPLLNLIGQLSTQQQYKLRSIIYQNKQLDEQSAKKYESSTPDEYGMIDFKLGCNGSYQNYGMIHISSIKFTEPYDLTVINEYESVNSITIPLELKVYLTCVSSSIYKTHLDYTQIRLGELKKMPTIVDGINYYHQTELGDDIDYDDPTYDEKMEELQKVKDTTTVLELRWCGCGYTDQIILKVGNDLTSNQRFVGQIWHQKFAGDGVFLKVNESFFDYALKILSN